MVLPRFAKLDPGKKAVLIAVATEEFAERGYEKASLNRIIARCGISKGAMYYYFADKDDLYKTVLEGFIQDTLEMWSGEKSLRERPFSHVQTRTAYWEEWVSHYRRSLSHSQRNPVFGEMFHRCIRSRASGTSHPALNEAADRIREWIRQALRRGQELGAVRSDLPEGLLLDTVFGMLEGFDRWMVQTWMGLSEDQVDEMARLVTGFLRRIAEPVTVRTQPREPRRKRRGR
jgi:AcrR family transcriptional regulator